MMSNLSVACESAVCYTFGMKPSLRLGINFGLTSGVITTLGLLVGLASGTNSREVVIAGVLTIAIADAFSDAMGVHVSQEAAGELDGVWAATFSTLVAKIIFALSFLVPLVLFSLPVAVWVSVAWGMALLAISSFFIARREHAPSWHIAGEHLFLAMLVMVATHYTGLLVRSLVF
jgi:vacuolar iron transporter family protein